jgi:MFS family permease
LSIYHPAGTALITHSLPMSGRVFAIHGMMGNLGVAGAGAVAGTLGALFGWRGALGSLSIFGIALGLRVLSLPTPSVPEVRRRPGRGHWPGYLTLLVGMGFLGMVYRGITTFLPKLFATRFAPEGTSGAALGGWLATAALLVGLAGMYVAGRAIDRKVAPARVFLAGAVIQAPFLVAVAWAADPTLLPLLMAVAFFHFVTQPSGNYMVAEYVPPRLRGMGYGVYFFVSFGMGSVGASIGGWVSEREGLELAFPAMAMLLVPAVAAALLLSFTRLGVKQRADS